ncbi:hypothetical protein F975_00530 [Acinetobacter sp. ANC 3789]|uniref:hypothetical protein n=1 Tax=Acinetobacter sp. ANC 3789 TaxID=1217714 RepID=UPI0002D0C2C3|nr:hypothetical protein [Acinetobacter sp. ANC 3789]ENU81914.1 hypothetical protein F975_00530 [Acinetobacter sp. ANC 3789]
MNAPRQGLFASLLIVSFALQTFLLVIATTHQLKENRASQGQLLTTQLVTDSLHELDPANRVSLALLVDRYKTNPSIASIRILDASNQVLATDGLYKTREGEVFSRDALQNEKKVGSVEVTLIKPSIGEILRSEWLAILASLILHFVLWIAYRAIARPSRSEYLARINKEMHLKHEIQALTQALEQEKHNSAVVIAQAQQQPKKQAIPNRLFNSDKTDVNPNPHALALNIQFYDPKQLLSTVSQSVSVPYFNLCQLFLKKSIDLCVQHYHLSQADINVQQSFQADGATITIDAERPKAVECLLMVGMVFQLLSEVLYKRYREEKRFVLQTRCAIANAVEDMQLNAAQAAARLTHNLTAKESALYLQEQYLKLISEHFQLVALPNPSNVLTRHAFMINGMNSECAELAQNLRTEILKSKKSRSETT